MKASCTLGLAWSCLLQIKPQDRCTIERVFLHTFLTGGNTMGMDAAAVQHLNESVDVMRTKV